MKSIDQSKKDLIENELDEFVIIETADIQDEAPSFVRISLQEEECLSRL